MNDSTRDRRPASRASGSQSEGEINVKTIQVVGSNKGGWKVVTSDGKVHRGKTIADVMLIALESERACKAQVVRS